MSECCNFEQMTDDDLRGLQAKISDVLDSRNVDEVAEFKKTDEFKALKKEWKVIKKLQKALLKSHEVAVEIPVTFKVKLEEIDSLEYLMEDGYDNGSGAISDFFEVSVEGKITGKPFAKELMGHVQDHLTDICGDLCSDVLKLKPEIYDSVEKHVDMLEKFRDKIDLTPVTVYDLEE